MLGFGLNNWHINDKVLIYLFFLKFKIMFFNDLLLRISVYCILLTPNV